LYRENRRGDELIEDTRRIALPREHIQQLWHAADTQADTIGFRTANAGTPQMNVAECQGPK
jgi:hypothetical protein